MKKLLPLLILSLILEFTCVIQGQNIFVNLKIFLEGPYQHPVMRTDLNVSGYLPLLQPYNIEPWNYSGSEQVISIPNPEVVDWVLVELRETAGNASTAYLDDTIARKAGFILKDGTIKDLDGISPLQFSLAFNYKLYAVVYFRNHLAVLSENQLTFVGNTCTYDFSINENTVYGGSTGYKQIYSGIWGMISGDANGDGQINNSDKNDIWLFQTGSSGYKSGDFSLDGQVNNADKINFWSLNTGSSSQIPGQWTCGKPIDDERDGQIYNTVQIGTQCWLADNLNIGIMIAANSPQQNNAIFEKFCYSNNVVNCETYGGLYQWNEMMQYSTYNGTQGICPDGWHLPTDSEWILLSNFLGGEFLSGGKMKSTGTLESGTGLWHSPNTGGNNSSGFTGLPAGNSSTGTFFGINNYGHYWSSTVAESAHAWSIDLSYNSSDVNRAHGSQNYGLSVRCLLD